MSVDIREYNRIIVSKHKQYLVSFDEYSKQPKWNPSPWDAWYTEDISEARCVAHRFGCALMWFNPVAGITQAIEQRKG